MGIISPTATTAAGASAAAPPPRIGLADALFSATQARVLGLIFGQPKRSFFASELIVLAGVGRGTVQRELARLEASGLVTAKRLGRQKHYQANPASPIFAELCAIARKTVGLAEPLRAALAPLASKIAAAFVFGSVAKGIDHAASDIDLMVIGDDVGYGDVFTAVEPLVRSLGRPVNPTIYDRAELAKNLRAKNAFTTRVLAGPKIWLIGSDDALAAR